MLSNDDEVIVFHPCKFKTGYIWMDGGRIFLGMKRAKYDVRSRSINEEDRRENTHPINREDRQVKW